MPGRADRTGLAAKLADHGVAFFPKAFSKDECALLIQQFVDNCEVNEVWLVSILTLRADARRGHAPRASRSFQVNPCYGSALDCNAHR